MNYRWQMRVSDNDRVYVADLTGSAEVGRQQNKDELQPAHKRSGDGWRVVIAPLEDITISRKHLEIKPEADGKFLLCNKSANQIVGLPNNQELPPGATCHVSLPVGIRLGKKTLRLQIPDDDEALSCLPAATLAPGSSSLLAEMHATFARSGAATMDTKQLMAWLDAFLGLLHSAAGSADFYVKAARALVDLVKLDSGRVLFRTGTTWKETAVQTSGRLQADREWQPSRSVLASVSREKKTFWQVPDGQIGASTRGVDAVVAAPILDRKGEVIGALYGERRQFGAQVQLPISQIEAMLVEVLATGVAAGLARVEQEQAALRARLQMEQFFGQRLAAKLVDHPEMLVGRDTVVSVLFCDLHGFSRISEKLGPARTVEWISDVMSVLTQCVLAHEGVVVDYVGDEVMAMWGAPEDQPDHAARACRTALAMFESLPRLNERWQATIQEPMSLGIGINSGIAQVGNVGSKMKFKYGALGNTVNLGSRVQGATKHLKTALLITDTTAAGLDTSFTTRRLCQVRVVNIAQPVTLHELRGAIKPVWPALKLAYEEALDAFTHAEFRQACRILGRLILDNPDDGPALILLARAVNRLVDESIPFDPVMVLAGK